MAWTQPKTWSNEPLIAGDMNTHIRDNLNALKNPPSEVSNFDGTGFSTTSGSFVDVDTTYLSSTITTHGGDLLVACAATVQHTLATIVDFDITVDGVNQGAANGIIRLRTAGSSQDDAFSLVYLLTGLAAGTYTVRLQWKTSGGTVTMRSATGGAFRGQWFVREVS